MIRACSFLPAVTSMIQEMGLADRLVGTTFECPGDYPRVVRSHLEGNAYSSEEIQHVVSSWAREGKSLYYVDIDLLQALQPDVIFTQDVCSVCQIGTDDVVQAIGALEPKPKIVSFSPRGFVDICENARRIAVEMGEPEAAEAVLADVARRIERIRSVLRAAGRGAREMMLFEWLEPVYNAGHWIPFQIEAAGGKDPLSNPEGYSDVIPWEAVLERDPEVIVLAPCGFDLARTARELPVLEGKPGWWELRAVRDRQVYLANPDLFTRPSTSLIQGIEVLAGALHPDLFGNPRPGDLAPAYSPAVAAR